MKIEKYLCEMGFLPLFIVWKHKYGMVKYQMGLQHRIKKHHPYTIYRKYQITKNTEIQKYSKIRNTKKSDVAKYQMGLRHRNWCSWRGAEAPVRHKPAAKVFQNAEMQN